MSGSQNLATFPPWHFSSADARRGLRATGMLGTSSRASNYLQVSGSVQEKRQIDRWIYKAFPQVFYYFF